MNVIFECNVTKFDIWQIRWGNIDCLKDSIRVLKITNIGTIPANLQVFLRLSKSKFELKVQTVLLNAGDSYHLEVTANVDDSIVIKEELHIMVDEGTFVCLSVCLCVCLSVCLSICLSVCYYYNLFHYILIYIHVLFNFRDSFLS